MLKIESQMVINLFIFFVKVRKKSEYLKREKKKRLKSIGFLKNNSFGMNCIPL